MCYPMCSWSSSNLKKVHPIVKQKPSPKKVKFFGFRFRNSFVENKNVQRR